MPYVGHRADGRRFDDAREAKEFGHRRRRTAERSVGFDEAPRDRRRGPRTRRAVLCKGRDGVVHAWTINDLTFGGGGGPGGLIRAYTISRVICGICGRRSYKPSDRRAAEAAAARERPRHGKGRGHIRDRGPR